MYIAASNEEIGKYLEKLIKANFVKDRRFAIAYLKVQNNTEIPSSEEIQKMANRLCQIKKGNKGIQITDLPIFAGLLGVSVDSILSAGKVSASSQERVTNYSIARSEDKKEWRKFIKRADKLILNPDEYNKTIIDYAFEFKNFGLIKFLASEGYIRFVGKNPSHYTNTFDPEIDIKRRSPNECDLLENKIAKSDEVRKKMIILALENGDYDFLNELHAREIPEYYMTTCFGNQVYDLKTHYNKEFLSAISASKDEVLIYFSEEYEIQSNLAKQKFTFTFPFLGELIDELVLNGSKAVPAMLKNAIKHNRNMLDKLQESAYESYKGFLGEDGAPYHSNEDIEHHILDYFRYFEKNESFSFFPYYANGSKTQGVFSNIIRVKETSKDAYVQSLIEVVNESYKKVAEFKFKVPEDRKVYSPNRIKP